MISAENKIAQAFELLINDQETCQSNGLQVFYGRSIKLKLTAADINDDTEILVSVKVKKAGEFITLAGLTTNLVLTIKNNQAISEAFYFNPEWFDESCQNYDYAKQQTSVDANKCLTFIFDAKFKDQTTIIEIKPNTYHRNYEELLGLFKTDNSGDKDNRDNYENKFINANPDIKNIVNKFVQAVMTEDIGEIKELIAANAQALWDASVEQFKNGRFDDRPLYWARNKMLTWLKRNPLFKDQIDWPNSKVLSDSDLATLIKLFEEKSRNYTGIDFSKDSLQSKILVTGFDPFLMNSIDHPLKNRFNMLQSNPSGCVALYLAANTLENIDIQTMLVPVRYSDFDSSQDNQSGQGGGIIERYIGPWIDKVDMIITISQSRPGDYNIDKFATARRGGFNDNLDYRREDDSLALETDYEWIETTLPLAMTKAPLVEYNWNFNGQENKDKVKPVVGQKISQGSGGSYLSNEIFYRVAKLRQDKRPTLATGHFHISKLQDEKKNEDFSNKKTKKMTEIVLEGIIKVKSKI